MKKQKKETNKPLRIDAKDVGSSENQIRLLSDKINNLYMKTINLQTISCKPRSIPLYIMNLFIVIAFLRKFIGVFGRI